MAKDPRDGFITLSNSVLQLKNNAFIIKMKLFSSIENIWHFDLGRSHRYSGDEGHAIHKRRRDNRKHVWNLGGRKHGGRKPRPFSDILYRP